MPKESFTEQISKQNPFAQGQIMIKSVKAIIGNILNTLNLIFSISTRLKLLGIPCRISKSITNSICKINSIALTQIKNITDTAKHIQRGGNINSDIVRIKKDLDIILKNILNTFTVIVKSNKKINIPNMPCETAKFITNKICMISATLDMIKAIFPAKTINKLKGIMSGDIKMNELDISNEANKLNKIINQSNNQAGGNLIWSKIVNPETGRTVNITGKIGKRVIRRYINQLI